MKHTLTYTIENEITVLDFLKRHGYSHSVITHLKPDTLQHPWQWEMALRQ